MLAMIDRLANALPCPLVAREAQLTGEGAVYNFNTTFFNGARRTARMKLNVYAKTMARAIEIEDAADAAMCTLSETPIATGCTACVRNGGGWYEDGEWQVRVAYYDLTLR